MSSPPRSPAWSDGGASLAAPCQQREAGGGSSSPGTLWLLQILFSKGYLWLFSHPLHPRKSFAAQQLAPVDSLLHGNRLYLQTWQEPSQRDSPSPAGSTPSALPRAQLLSNPTPAACTTPLLQEAEHPELLLNSAGAEAAQQQTVPTLHLQHWEMCSPRVGPDVITTTATPGSLFICSLVPEAPAAGMVSVEQLSCSPPWLLGKDWQLCLNPLSPAAGRKPLPDFVLKQLRWDHSCPILLTHCGGGRQQREGNNKQLEGVKGEVMS